VPVPRRFDRRPPERDTTRINERIRVPEVRLIDDTGEQQGVMKIDDALRFAQERDLDLVEVAPEAKPPVVRVLDYSKYKYEQAQKLKQARKHQQQITIREIKFRPKIAQHDYETKKGHVERFLRHKDKVKVTIMFRGREVTHPERGLQLLDRLAEELAEYAVIEQRPLHDGRNMTMMLGPSKAVLSGHFDKPAANGSADGAALEQVVAAASGNGATPAVAEAPETAAVPVSIEPSGGNGALAPEAVAEAPAAEPAVAPVAVAQAPPAVEEAPKGAPARTAAAKPKSASPKATVAKAASAKAASPKPPAKPRSGAAKSKPTSGA
jgi:translation initiation factor IF-3